MNFLLQSSDRVPFYTDMCATRQALGIQASACDWFVSDVETNVTVPALAEGDTWVTGDELSRLLADDTITVTTFIDGNVMFKSQEILGTNENENRKWSAIVNRTCSVFYLSWVGSVV